MDDAHVELDHVGPQKRHEREGARVDADIVEGDAGTELAEVFDRPKDFCRTGRERALRQLEDDAVLAAGGRDRLGVLTGDPGGRSDRFDVDEDGGLGAEVLGGGAAKRRGAARPVEFDGEPAACRGAEEVTGHRERGLLRPARQRLKGDHLTTVEVDDRLEVADDQVVSQQSLQLCTLRAIISELGRLGRHGGHTS